MIRLWPLRIGISSTDSSNSSKNSSSSIVGSEISSNSPASGAEGCTKSTLSLFFLVLIDLLIPSTNTKANKSPIIIVRISARFNIEFMQLLLA